jgi:hypothetical protein
MRGASSRGHSRCVFLSELLIVARDWDQGGLPRAGSMYSGLGASTAAWDLGRLPTASVIQPDGRGEAIIGT